MLRMEELVDLYGYLTPAGVDHVLEHRRLARANGESEQEPPPIVPAGLAPFLRLPPREPRTLTRARMAAEIVRAMSVAGCVTLQDLESAGFCEAEIAEHFTAARRAARAHRMVI